MPSFSHPLWFLLPLAIVPALLAAWFQEARGGGRLAALVAPRLREKLLPPVEHGPRGSRLALRFFLLLALAAALARPQWGTEARVESSNARDILLAIDTSRSMLATDTPPNRLQRAKLACLDLLKALPEDRFGVIGFAGTAFPLAPLTTDHDAIRETLQMVDTESLPVGGSDLAAAVETAISAFSESTRGRRALVILSDGEDLGERLRGIAEKARENGIFIFAFAIGTERGTMIPDPSSPGGFIRDASGQPVVTRRNSTTLEQLARDSGGYAAVLSDQGSLAAHLHQGLARLDAFSSEEKSRDQAAERFQWPLAAALLLMIVCLVRRPGPRAVTPVPMVLAAGLSCHLASAPAARAADPGGPLAEAAALHAAGKYDEAIAAGASALNTPNSADRAIAAANLAQSLYSAGRAALPEPSATPDPAALRAILNDWEDALGHLEESLRLRPDHQATVENRGRVRKAVETLRSELERLEQEKKQENQQNQQSKERQPQQQKDEPQDKENSSSDSSSPGKPQDSPASRDQREPDGKSGEGQPKQDPAADKSGTESPAKPQPSETAGQEEKQDQSGQAKAPEQKAGKPEESGKPEENSQQGDRNAKRQSRQGNSALPDASSGDGPRSDSEAGSSVALPVGPDGRIQLPEDPAQRAKTLEAIRRQLEQRSMENRRVRLLPEPSGTTRPERDW